MTKVLATDSGWIRPDGSIEDIKSMSHATYAVEKMKKIGRISKKPYRKRYPNYKHNALLDFMKLKKYIGFNLDTANDGIDVTVGGKVSISQLSILRRWTKKGDFYYTLYYGKVERRDEEHGLSYHELVEDLRTYGFI